MAQANGTEPGLTTCALRLVHNDPGTNVRSLAALTATIEIAMADDVVMMSGVGTNWAVAVAENPDCT